MATTPNMKVFIDVDVQPYQAALQRFRRHTVGLGLAVELAATVTEEQIESVLEEFRTDQGHAKSESDLRWLREVTPDWERMVTDGIAWLIAAQEYTAALEAAQTSTEA